MRLMAVAALALLMGLPSPSKAQSAHPALGAWRGSLDYVRPDGKSQLVYFGFNVSQDAGTLKGVVASSQIGLEAEIEGGSLRRNAIEFRFRLAGEAARFSGSVDTDALKGSLTSSQGARPVVLERVFSQIDPSHVRPRAGLYVLEDGGQLILAAGRWTFNSFDVEEGNFRVFFPRSEHEFIAGSGGLPAPAEARLSFEGTRIVLASATGKRTGRKSDALVEEEITFRNGETTLAGLLIRPRVATRPMPGAVVIWGSGRQDRYGFQGLPYYRAVMLAQKGFAAIVYDKRGIGKSTGSYEQLTQADLAGDMAAAVDYLAARPEVDSSRVGLLVHSQSGIYAPETILKSGKVAFAAVISTTVVNGEVQEIVRTEQQLRADGWPKTDIDDAVATQILKFYYANHRIGWDAYVSAYRRVVDKPWFESVIGSTIDKERHSWEFWRQGNSYEPARDWAKVKAPVLYLAGDRDTITPVNESLLLLRGAFSGPRAKLLTTKLYLGAEHSLFYAETGGVLEEASLSRVHPYMDDIVGWLRDIGVAPR